MEKLKEILKNYLNNGSDRIDVTMVLSLIDQCEKDDNKQLLLHNVSQHRELLMATLTSRVLTIQNEPDGIVRETMINNLLIDINCG